MTTYEPTPTGVRMVGVHGDINLTPGQADQLASIYHKARAVRDFNALVDAIYAHRSATLEALMPQHVAEGRGL